MTSYRTIIRKLKPVINSSSFTYCNIIKDSIKGIEKLGYTVKIQFVTNDDIQTMDLCCGYYNVYLNDTYITAIGYTKDNFAGFLRLSDKLETIYRTLFFKNN